jgi:FdhD protein
MEKKHAPLDALVGFDVMRLKQGAMIEETVSVATEIPFTIVANDTEIATLMCTPLNLEELTVGFLFTSGFISGMKDIKSYRCDEQMWRADVDLENDPDSELLEKRLYAAGCGRGVIYASATEFASSDPLENDLVIDGERIVEITKYLQTCSELYRATGGVHTAVLSTKGETPHIMADDIGRHNAVDKVIGRGLIDNTDFSKTLIASTGRISSEILHKAKKSGIPIIVSRGAPTHQTILMAREMNMTIVGFARGGGFTIYTAPERVKLQKGR